MNFQALLDLLDKGIEKSAKKLNNELLDILENNGDLNGAFASFSDDFWADFLKAYNKANGGELSLGELMSLRIDKISLSDALYTALKESKNAAKSVIKTAIKEQKSANELAKMLYEGYDFKADPLKVKTKYPKYLWKTCAKTKVKNIKTPALKAAYSKLLKDESKLVSNKALKIAGYEKASYNAKRIALNETARAYNDARAFEYSSKSDIQAVKIQMSKTHPRTDICDYYASVDKYGLGAGVYPKHKAPVPPFHPFCRCQMIPLYADEYSKAKLNANADKEYLLSLKEWQRARIVGSRAKADEAMKTGDINSVFNAMKPGRYKVKSINEVVGNLAIIRDLNETDSMVENEKFNKIIDNILDGNIIKDKSKQLAIVGNIPLKYKKQIESLLGKKLVSQDIAITQNEIWHAIRGSKPNHKKASSEDIYNIPNILASNKHIYFDKAKNNLLYFSKSINQTQHIIYIAINLNYTIKTFGEDNYIITISKFKNSDYKSRIKTLVKLRG